ncbi:ammonium transporter [Microseira wollei NIES-4236]|uniref:Ammonium transporter n=1 Tax=Microseira wollei NIES-4236 TaxID=2530354 RepID=A0AAV3WP91_9CYAN|nr:ammonium transporter [Microseira wollei]GET43779.1 ammonium transporter [Microseira wollei NIES-4236]
MLRKVLVAGIIALCLLGGIVSGNVFAQDASPTVSPAPGLNAPTTISPSPGATLSPAPGLTAPTTVAPEATLNPAPGLTGPTGVSPSPEATLSPAPGLTSPTGVSPLPEATLSPTPGVTVPDSTAPSGLQSPAPGGVITPAPIAPPDASRQEASPAAVEAPKIDTGDTAWMLISSALVLLMTPGLAFFYGGLVRSRNVLNTMMMSLLLMALVGVTWTLWGYSLAFDVTKDSLKDNFAQGIEQFIGGLDWLFLNNVSADQPDPIGYAGTVPHQVFMVYQMMFAIITPALISGAIVERISFKAYFWFMLLWSSFIYSPLAHWVWGKGWIGALGALDFAGGTVVHISSGVSAVVAVLMIGPRKTYPDRPAAPHNVPYVLLGIGLLWFGWFGFNGGSALAAGGLATVAFVTTMISTAAGGLTWMIVEWVLRGKPTAVGIASGFLGGLVGITPAAGYVTPVGAILIGSITSVCCFYAVSLRAKLQFDDSLDTFGVHGTGGTIGALLTGIFATKAVNSAGDNGLLFGNPAQLWEQFVGVIATYIFAAAGTFVILKILGLFMPLRVKPIVEEQGLDINEHGEEGYGEEFASGLSFTNMRE